MHLIERAARFKYGSAYDSVMNRARNNNGTSAANRTARAAAARKSWASLGAP